jgi:hypothetical protein
LELYIRKTNNNWDLDTKRASNNWDVDYEENKTTIGIIRTKKQTTKY